MFIELDKVAKTACLGIITSMLLILNCSSDPNEADVINISNTPGCSEHPAIAVDSRGYFYVVWDDNFVTQESLVVYMVTGSPTGVWSDPVKIFEPRAANFPDNEVDNSNTIHLIWRNTNSVGWDEVLYTEKSLGGNWTEPDTISIYGMSASPDLALDNSGDVHIVWREMVGPWPIFYIKKAGGIWSIPVEISKGSVFARYALQIAVDPQGYAHVVWEETKTDTGPSWIAYTTNAAGDTFSHPADIYPVGPSYELQSNPSIAVDNDGTVHVVWSQYKDIFYTLKTSDTQWETPVRVCSTSALSRRSCLVADSDGSLHLVWVEGDNTFCYTSKVQEDDWDEPKSYTVNIEAFPSPKLAISSTSIGVVFSDICESGSSGYENYDIFFVEIPQD